MSVLTKDSFKVENFVVRDTLIKSEFLKISSAPSDQTPRFVQLKTPHFVNSRPRANN